MVYKVEMPEAVATSRSSASTGDVHRPRGILRGAWRAMNDWGDGFERRHFDGDLKGKLKAAPLKAVEVGNDTLKAMNDWGDELERTHFEGDFVGTLAEAPHKAVVAINSTLAVIDNGLDGFAPPSFPNADASLASTDHLNVVASAGNGLPLDSKQGLVGSWEEMRQIQDERRLQADAQSSAIPALWEVAQRLKEQIVEERERRKGRAAAVDGLDEALRLQRLELAEERQLVASGEEQRSVSGMRSYSQERCFAQLQERHHSLLSRRASHEAQIHKLTLEASAATVAAAEDDKVREAEGRRAWARAGPEMEALKEAKLELAEVLGLLDEARMHRRRELLALQDRLSKLEEENAALRLASDGYVAPGGSFRASLRRLVSVAFSRSDLPDS